MLTLQRRLCAAACPIGSTVGPAADFQVALLDQYTSVYRRTTGKVRVVQPQGATPGDIPGLRLEVDSDASTATISIKVNRAGTLRIMHKEVEVMANGKVPA